MLVMMIERKREGGISAFILSVEVLWPYCTYILTRVFYCLTQLSKIGRIVTGRYRL